MYSTIFGRAHWTFVWVLLDVSLAEPDSAFRVSLAPRDWLDVINFYNTSCLDTLLKKSGPISLESVSRDSRWSKCNFNVAQIDYAWSKLYSWCSKEMDKSQKWSQNISFFLGRGHGTRSHHLPPPPFSLLLLWIIHYPCTCILHWSGHSNKCQISWKFIFDKGVWLLPCPVFSLTVVYQFANDHNHWVSSHFVYSHFGYIFYRAILKTPGSMGLSY